VVRPLTALIVIVAIAFLVLLWISIRARRNSIRTLLLTTGSQTRGTTSLVWPRGTGAPSVAVTYTASDGITRTAVKTIVSAGDAELMKKTAMVVYHPKRTTRSDYVLVGFGELPTTWFRVNFARLARPL
jgi:hypothetical protein